MTQGRGDFFETMRLTKQSHRVFYDLHRTREELLSQRKTHIVLAGNKWGDDWGHDLPAIVFGLSNGPVYAGATPAKLCHVTTEIADFGGIDVDVGLSSDWHDDANKFDDIVQKSNATSGFDIDASAKRILEMNQQMVKDQRGRIHASVFLVDSRVVMDESCLKSRMGGFVEQGIAPFIFHAVEPQAAYHRTTQDALELCAAYGGGHYVSFPKDRMAEMSEHMSLIGMYALGLPSIIKMLQDYAETPSGKLFAQKLSQPYRDITL